MRLFLGIIAGLLALVVTVYLAVNGVATFRAHQARGDISDRVAARLADAVPTAEARQQELVVAAGREPDATWIEQVCRFDTDDAGWMVQNHREVCNLRSVSVWAVGDEAEARALLPVVAGDEQPAYDGCLHLGTVGESEVTWVDVAASDGEPYCFGAGDDVRVVRGERTNPDADQLIRVTDVQPLVDEAIGCAHWSVLFCDNPFGDRHAFADVPAQ